MATDACKAKNEERIKGGLGGFFGTFFWRTDLADLEVEVNKVGWSTVDWTIQYLELLAWAFNEYLALKILKGKRTIAFCDNQNVESWITKSVTLARPFNTLLALLTDRETAEGAWAQSRRQAARYILHLEWVGTKDNTIADALSRGDIKSITIKDGRFPVVTPDWQPFLKDWLALDRKHGALAKTSYASDFISFG